MQRGDQECDPRAEVAAAPDHDRCGCRGEAAVRAASSAAMPAGRNVCTGNRPPSAAKPSACSPARKRRTSCTRCRRSRSPWRRLNANACSAACSAASEGGLQWTRVSLSLLEAPDQRSRCRRAAPSAHQTPWPANCRRSHRRCDALPAQRAAATAAVRRAALLSRARRAPGCRRARGSRVCGSTHRRYSAIGAALPQVGQKPSATTIGRRRRAVLLDQPPRARRRRDAGSVAQVHRAPRPARRPIAQSRSVPSSM